MAALSKTRRSDAHAEADAPVFLLDNYRDPQGMNGRQVTMYGNYSVGILLSS